MTATTGRTVTPTAVQVLPPEADQATWLAARRGGIGASEVAAIVGVSKYDGPLKVCLDKWGLLPPRDSAAMEWGRRLERAVLEKFQDEHPDLYVMGSPGLCAHAGEGWRRCTPDGLISDGPTDEWAELFESKTGSSRDDEWGEPGTDEIPYSYLCQVTWSCDILSLPRWRVAVLLDGRDYREYAGDLDPSFATSLRTRCFAFWFGNVVAGVQPAADDLDSTAELLSARHRKDRSNEDEVELPSEAADWLKSYHIHHQAEKAAKKGKQGASNWFKQAQLAAGDGRYGLLDGERVTDWRPSGGGPKEVFDLDVFRAEHPKLAAKYTKTETTDPTYSMYVIGGASK